MASPLVRDLPADPFSHGVDGLGYTGRPEPQTPIDERHATDTLFEEAKTNDGEVTLITLGPLSNPALTLLKYPEWADKITRHVMIGGLFGVTPHAFERPTGKNPVSEWNVYVDPEAADRVIDAPFETVAVGLDVTTSPEMRFRDRHVSTLEAAESPVADFVLELITFVRERGFTTYTTLIDPLAVALAVDEGLAETRRIRTTVETDSSITRGQTVPDLRKNPLYETDDFSEVDVVTDVNYEGFLSLLVDRLVEA
jgi:purine nucleosidase/pyrimidine-specific ribonucleoside hydrolase